MSRPAVSFAQLEAFSEVVRLGSFTRAAHALHLTQAGLSARLLKLEQQLECTLFERTSRGAELTDAGRALLPFARRALTAMDEGARLVRGLPAGGLGRLVVAVSPEVPREAVSRIVDAFHAAAPHMQIRVRTHPASEVHDLVAREEVQLGIAPTGDRRDVRAEVVHEAPLVLVVAPAHPLAGRPGVRLSAVAEHTVVVADRGVGSAEDALFHQHGLALHHVLEVDGIETAKRLALAGAGIAALPLSAVEAEVGTGALRAVTPVDAPLAHLRLALVRSAASSPLSQLVERYVQIAAIACSSLDAASGLAQAGQADAAGIAGLGLTGLMQGY